MNLLSEVKVSIGEEALVAVLSLFCGRAWEDYSFETCIGLVNPHKLYVAYFDEKNTFFDLKEMIFLVKFRQNSTKYQKSLV